MALVVSCIVGPSCSGRRVVAPGGCPQGVRVGAIDTWPSWGGTADRIYYVRRSRVAPESTWLAVVDLHGNSTLLAPLPYGVQELDCNPNTGMAVFGIGLELGYLNMENGDTGLLTSGGQGAHWPQWSPQGTSVAYSRVLRYPSAPDSTAGVRILDLLSGADRALMRTSSRAWHSRGPIAWSPQGDSLAFVSADSLVDGRTPLVIVPLGGGAGMLIGWTDGVPGGIAWLKDGSGWLFDSTPRDCPVNESQRRTWAMRLDGVVVPFPWNLGDARVFNGYPFDLSADQSESVHVGLADGVGLICVTSLITGSTRVVTTR